MPKLWNNQIIDLSKINTNEILDFSFNFELLKYVITSLINNQSNMDIQLNDMKLSLIKQQKYSSELESAILDLKIEKEENADILGKLMEKKDELLDIQMKLKNQEENIIEYTGELFNNIETFQRKKINKEKEKEINEGKENTQTEEENEEENLKEDNIDIDEYKDIDNNVEKENIIKEEKKINETEKNNFEEENNDNENIVINEVKEDINNKEKIDIIKKEEDNIKENIKEGKKEGIDIVIPSISNELASINNKHQDIHKELQLIVVELKNIKSKNNILEKDLLSFKTNITKQIKENFGNDIPSLIDKSFEKKSLVIKKSIKKENDKINDDINNIKNELNEKLSALNESISKEISSKEEKNTLELEQMTNSLNSFKKDLSLLDEKLLNLVTILAFNNYKKEMDEKMENDKKSINLEILNIKSNLGVVKDQLNDHLCDKKDHDNLTFLMRIVENITNEVKILLNFKKIVEEKDKRKVVIDNSKYVKQEGFNEVINNINKNIDNNKKEFNEIRLDLDNIKTKDLNVKANLRDLKNLEDTVFSKMEELKETIKNNFVEKIMLVKNLKYLELQTKELIEESQKKSEKHENWLLSKKPFNGHLCASCESYIGDLKQNTNSKYIAWNKYPMKESIDKIFRINAGFSKILQMSNHSIENRHEKMKSNSFNNSKEEKGYSSAEEDKNKKYEKIPNFKKGKNRIKIPKNINQSKNCSQIDDYDAASSLPKISNLKSINFNIFSEESKKVNNSNIRSKSLIYDEETNTRKEDNDNIDKESEQPIITKIYRKFAENQENKDEENKK